LYVIRFYGFLGSLNSTNSGPCDNSHDEWKETEFKVIGFYLKCAIEFWRLSLK
jgi:hypothetical protein